MDHVFIINMDRYPDRLEMTKRTAELLLPGVPVTRWPAAVIPDNDSARALGFVHPERLCGGLGAVGCCMSHVRILEHMLASGLPHVLILEDDAECYAHGPDVFAAAREELPPDWELLYVTIQATPGGPPFTRYSEHLVVPGHGLTASAYAVSASGAQKLLAAFRARAVEWDMIMRDVFATLKVFLCVPFATTQRTGNFSTITPDNMTLFHCWVPFHVTGGNGGSPILIVNLGKQGESSTSWPKNAETMCRALTWRAVNCPHGQLYVLPSDVSCPASFPFPKWVGSVGGTDGRVLAPEDLEGVPLDGQYLGSVLDTLLGGAPVPPALASADTVGITSDDGYPVFLFGPGALTTGFEARAGVLCALWLATKARVACGPVLPARDAIPSGTGDMYAAVQQRKPATHKTPVFVVSTSTSAAMRAAQTIYHTWDIRAPFSACYVRLFDALAHGNAHHRIIHCIRQQSDQSMLWFGSSWLLGNVSQLCAHWSDAIVVDADKLAPAEHCDLAVGEQARLDAHFPRRAIDVEKQALFPCFCARGMVIGDDWCLHDHDVCGMAVRHQSSPDVLPGDVHLLVDAAIPRARTSRCTSIGYVVEPDVVDPGNAARGASCKDSCALFAARPRVPFGSCWLSRDEVNGAAEGPMPKTFHAASVLASGKRHAPGHKMRHDIARYFAMDARLQRFGAIADVPSRLPSKAPTLLPFGYVVVVENDRERGYFTEKLIDALVARCVVFYWGDPAVYDVFDSSGVIAFETLAELDELLATMTAEDYAARAKGVGNNHHRALAYACWVNNLILHTGVLSLKGIRTTRTLPECDCASVGTFGIASVLDA